MVTFRNSLVLLAVVAMMATVASAQISPPPFSCNASAGVPPLVRSEGIAELTGDVLLICSGGVPTAHNADVPKVNFRVFLNTNVTSRLLDTTTTPPWNEALLMIDDPAPTMQKLCPDSNGCSLLGIGAEPGVDYAGTNPFRPDAEYNVWQGHYISGATAPGNNVVEWLGVPVDPPGTQQVRTIRITNIRANASVVGVGSGLIPTSLIAYVSATGPNGFPIDNPQQVVAFVQRGMDFSADEAQFLQCEDPSEDGIALEFDELFATAFKRRNVSTAEDAPTAIGNQNTPGQFLNTETGFYNSSFSSHGAGSAGLASQGTRVVAHFSAIPSGVDLYVTNSNLDDAGGCGGVYGNKASIVPGADSNGAGGTANAFDATCPIPETKLTPSNNMATATWEVLVDDPHAVNSLVFKVRVDYTPNTTAGNPALGTGAVAGTYGPLSDQPTAISDDLQPRFVNLGDDPEDFMTINSCATNLLWPYVTNQVGFDTGMVIANTSDDIFSLTASQEGSCEIYYFGNTNGGPGPAMDETPTIPAGGHAVWTLSTGGGVMPKDSGLTGVIGAASGFQGYVIAHCFFQYAHGYAFISDLGAQKLAQGYLALVLDESIFPSGSRTGSKSEPLDQ